MRHAEFDHDEDERSEPVTFKLLGESFTCVPEAPAGVTEALESSMILRQGQFVYSNPSLVRFVEGVLVTQLEYVTIPRAEAEAAGLEIPEDTEVDPIQVPTWQARAKGVNVEGRDRTSLPTDDRARFRLLVNDPTRTVTSKKLGELVRWLSTEYSGRHFT